MPESECFNQCREQLRSEITAVTQDTFETLALKLFRFQAAHNLVYRSYLGHLGCNPQEIKSLSDIPFLPISFFKKHKIVTGQWEQPARVFESSGTTGAETSRHLLRDPALYETLSRQIFEDHYGELDNYHILALLPSYLERNNSSLVDMVKHFMEISGSSLSGFFLNDFGPLNQRLSRIAESRDGRKVLLIGVTFALLDWADGLNAPDGDESLRDTLVVMETGGMKGRRREMLRSEVHAVLKSRLGVGAIHSEYGMTELTSQAYALSEGVFKETRSLRVLIRDITDPLTIRTDGQTGGVNVIDLGNLDSCAFIETSDLGRKDEQNGTFEIVGRHDNADVRGCNLLYF